MPTTFCRSTRHHGDVVLYVCVHEYFEKFEFLLPSTARRAGAVCDVELCVAGLPKARLIKLISEI